jgi:hypothetical protein
MRVGCCARCRVHRSLRVSRRLLIFPSCAQEPAPDALSEWESACQNGTRSRMEKEYQR